MGAFVVGVVAKDEAVECGVAARRGLALFMPRVRCTNIKISETCFVHAKNLALTSFPHLIIGLQIFPRRSREHRDFCLELVYQDQLIPERKWPRHTQNLLPLQIDFSHLRPRR
jgi:hypothetical protein